MSYLIISGVLHTRQLAAALPTLEEINLPSFCGALVQAVLSFGCTQLRFL